jgi:hypothetical protein
VQFWTEANMTIQGYDNNNILISATNNTEGPFMERINIYELAHKCKEWAFKHHNIILWSGLNTCHYHTPIIEKSFTKDTEAEAIFKACQWIQWIYDNKDKQ